MLSLNMRPARFNQDYRGKTQEKDGTITKKLHFGLDEIGLDETDLGAFTGEAHAYRSLYNTGGAQAEPYLACFKAYAFHEDIDNAAVTVRLHGGTEYKFTGCKLTKIKLRPTSGGVTMVSCKVEATPALDASLAELVANFGEIIDVEMHGTQPSDQQDLVTEANKFGEGEQSQEPKKRGRPRKSDTHVN